MPTRNPLEIHIERSNEESQPFVWLVYTAGAVKKLTYSESYTSRAGAINAVATVQAGNAVYEAFRGTDSYWYFRIKGLNGLILARSAYKYPTQSGALSDMHLVENNVADAPVFDLTRA